ncbi:MAG: SpoIID/LytB domain-containing protein [Clostridia bacterium]|nr:SpoIID/LytB domain-containing protein [Clostridia bacterium]
MKRSKGYVRVLTAALLALALLTGPCTQARAGLFDWFTGDDAQETATPAPTPALPASKLEDDGWLRVSLRSIGAPQQLHLTLAGVYAVESDPGFRFDRGLALTLTAVDGEVWLSAGGVTIAMGGALTLTRHAAAEGEENGLYIEESGRDTLYRGDLSVTASGDGLESILRIQVEDYLYGVVAYEMSDSFPIEALKAQAVAARTYALQRKWNAGSRAYDLVDTTADQVFKGYSAEYMNVVSAVDATRGVVGTYRGSYAVCYYTASNGGQTALPSQIWGRNDADGYLAMVDDPYDLENPRSLVNDLSFTAKCDGSLKLKQMLTAALEPVMADAGFAPDTWVFDAISGIEPVDPRFDGSYMYDRLAFDLKVRVAESALASPTPAPTEAASGDLMQSEAPSPSPTVASDVAPQPERWVDLDDTFRVELSVYDDIKDGLSMGLNGTDCELISVETDAAADGTARSFRLLMRRYGHGVGMSQRGAQYMAGHYGKDWLEILRFYYPGMTLERLEWPTEPLTALEAIPEAVGAARPKPTPKPTPAPLPALKRGEHYATVTATSLNMREKPTTAARIVDVLGKGRKLIVSGSPDADGWVPVHTAEYSGFVKAEYLAE